MQKHLVIVAAEGSKWLNGEYISANENEADNFGHPKFRGCAEVLSEKLKGDLKKFFGKINVNSVNPSYLYRSGKPNKTDTKAAVKLGRAAINTFTKKLAEPVFLSLSNKKKDFKAEKFFIKDLKDIEEFHRFVDNKYYDSAVFYSTNEFKKYLSRIIIAYTKVNLNI